MTERPDGSLARVTYLFGGPSPEHPAGRSAVPGTPDAEKASAEKADAEKLSAEKLSAEKPDPGESAWAVPGVSGDQVATSGDADHVEPGRVERRAHNVGLNALARRGMSVHEMRALLVKRELEPETVEAELERLCSSGLLDDDALAEDLVRTLSERKRVGRSAISAELNRRRIDPASIEVALSVLGDDELEQATEVAVARVAQLRSYDRETVKRRLSAFLARRGYSGSTASAAIRAALDSQPLDAARSSGGPRFE